MTRFLLAAALGLVPALASASPGHAVRVDHHIAGDAPSIGPHDAPVTIELFFMPGQVSAHDAYRTLMAVQAKHPTRLRAVFRLVRRNQSTPAIVLAAHRLGLFSEMMDALSASSLAPTPAATVEIAIKIGVSRAAVERAHLDDGIEASLAANKYRYNRLGLTSNPEFVINGRPLSAALNAATATVENLDTQYRIAFADARRALGQGIPARGLVEWGEQHAACGDDALDQPPLAGEVADKNRDDEPPTFAWRLATLLARGTGCPVVPHMPSTLDEYNPDDPPHRDSPPLHARPLPATGLPSSGPADAPVPIFVVCNPRGRFCNDQRDLARHVAEYFPGQVRVVWVPWVDLALDGADRDLTLAQAALCANALGDGWGFLDAAKTAGVSGRSAVDLAVIATNAGFDADALVTCASGEPMGARAAVEAARAAGIGYGPTVVIGGRAYLGGFSSDRAAATRVSAELAPGLLEALIPSW
jgi:2-hydroxychromene-2-carboxylate isomerase